MGKFIFHIGMHKCASTTLQNQVFNQEPGFIGVNKELYKNPDINFGKQFQDLAPVGGRQFGSLSGVENWVEKVKKFEANNNLDVERFIVSNEFLCQSNKINQRPIIKFLNDVNNEILGGNGIKIVIVFRNQLDMVASNYAQNSHTNHRASQADFEEMVAKELKNVSNTHLDWGEWAEDLVTTFGKNNVCILLMEEMRELIFWEKLTSFIDAKSLKAEQLYYENKISKKNSNKLSSKTWSLKPFDISKKAKIDVNKVESLLAGFGLKKRIYRNFFHRLISLRVSYLKWAGYESNQQKGGTIKLTNDISTSVRQRYKDSNMKLANILGRDITRLGY